MALVEWPFHTCECLFLPFPFHFHKENNQVTYFVWYTERNRLAIDMLLVVEMCCTAKERYWVLLYRERIAAMGAKGVSLKGTYEEHLELMQMKENIHRSVYGLEMCLGCERVCECEERMTEGVQHAWHCATCRKEAPLRVKPSFGSSLWRSSKMDSNNALADATRDSVLSRQTIGAQARGGI